MAPYNNIVGQYLRLRNPSAGDYRPIADSEAEAYGCQTFDFGTKTHKDQAYSPLPIPGIIKSGSSVEVGGLITQATTWDAEIIRVTQTVEVTDDASLTIAPGTRVEFDGFFKLIVHGRLWAVGNAENRIIFTTSDEQIAEVWDGIEFINIPAANDSSRLEHCHLSNALAKPDKNGTSLSQCGGAVSIIGVNKLAIASCEFENNHADYGAAIYCGYGSSPVLAGNLFHENSANLNGSVLYNVYAYPKLINNTIVQNTCLAESDFHECAAVENFNGKILLINNIIRDNYTNHYSGTQLVSNKDYYVLNNNIEEYVGNNTNQDTDPEFLGAGSSPYQLNDGSPCIDQGVESSISSTLASHDINGNERLWGGVIDLGAYEYSGVLSGMVSRSSPLATACVPNPFNPQTIIFFNLPEDATVVLTVHDLRGRLVRTLIDSWTSAGHNKVMWNGRNDDGRAVASGLYLYRIQAGGISETNSMTLVR